MPKYAVRDNSITLTHLKGNLTRFKQIGLIIGSIAFALSLSCFPTLGLISVSDNGKYVVFAVDRNGCLSKGTLLGEGNKKKETKICVLDIEKDEITCLEETFGEISWLSNNSGKIAYVGNSDDKLAVHIISEGKHEIIKNAIFPSLSEDGKLIAYSKILNFDIKDFNPVLCTKDIETGVEKCYEEKGLFPDYSPNKKRLSYIVRNETILGEYAIMVREDETSQLIGANNIAHDMTSGNVYPPLPLWIDAHRIIFVGYQRSHMDPQEDVIIYNVNKATIEKVTDTSGKEFFPQMAKDGKVVFGVPHPLGVFPIDDTSEQIMKMIEKDILISEKKEGKQTTKRYKTDSSNSDSYFICVAKKKDGKWNTTPSKVQTPFFRIAHNKLIYTKPHKKETRALFPIEEDIHVFMLDLDNLDAKPVNLSERMSKVLEKSS